jgi:hypothetical protein
MSDQDRNQVPALPDGGQNRPQVGRIVGPGVDHRH